jgi:hypothetical protein
MGNIFNDTDFHNIVDRIKLISKESEKQWGQMSIEEMLAHCITQMRMALGEVTSQPQGSFVMRTVIGKWLAFSDIPWPKGSNTPIEMNVKKSSIQIKPIEREQEELVHYLNLVRNSSQLSPHPFFGALNQKEWGQLIYKHLDHHLKQFRK